MLGWIFKKNAGPDGQQAAADPPTAPAAPAALATPRTPNQAAAAIDWPQRLQAAQDNPAALLAIARDGAPLPVQQAAIDAVTDEAALKLAERDWRGHDRRLHRLVKQHYLAQVARREARERAARLIATGEALRHETPIPTNRLVELDREWRLLEPALVDAAQTEAYAGLLAELTALTRERGDQALKVQRWTAEARQALDTLQRGMADVAAGTSTRDAVDDAVARVRAALDATPDAAATTPSREALQGALQTSALLGDQLDLLDALLQAPPAAQAEALARWEGRATLADAGLGELLAQRAAQWQTSREAALQARRTEQRTQARERRREGGQQRTEQLAAALDRGENALAEGHLADAHRHLVAIDDLLDGAAAPAPLAARLDRLQAGYAQLKGWQHWGGGLARDELVLQAEALAAVSQREPDARGVRLSVRQRAEVIDDMRARWKELDRLGGATSRALWQRFDASLKTAWLPVAEHQAQQRAARAQNLQSRLALIEELDAVARPTGDADTPDWKAAAGALEHLRSEWRKLGPLEHTVPHPARAGLAQRLEAATARLEGPLAEARRVAQSGRERLVARARQLADQAIAGSAGRDSLDRVRELQAEWQHHARALPLARAVETALWTEFKAAVDAVFGAREAAFSARDLQFKAGAAERLALIERLESFAPDVPDADLKRALAETDASWQRAAPPPRQEAVALEARWRATREQWQRHLAGSARRVWQARCDALAARLALCDAADDSTDPAAARAELKAQWPAPAALLPAWDQALARRVGLADRTEVKRGAMPVDDLLLRLEMAAGLASPTAHDQARRELKLQALKATLEGRQVATPPAPGRLLVDLLERGSLETAQRGRLSAVVAGLRAGEPLAEA